MKKFLPKTINNPKGSPRFAGEAGFTLVELMVVISIIAILSVIAIAVYSNSQKGARDAKRRADIDSLSSSLEQHYNETSAQYCTGSSSGTYCAPLDSWFTNGAIPTDPSTGAQYSGLPADGGATYTICATLEVGQSFCKSNQR